MYARDDDVVTFIGQFLASGAAATGLTVTAKVWEIRSNGAKVPNDTTGTTASVTELGGGFYYATFTMTGDGVPVCVFSTTGTADQTSIGTAALSLSTLATATAVAALPTDADVNAACDTAISDAALATAASIAALNDFDPATDVVAEVTLVDTCTTNTDMRGTDGAVTSLAGIATATNVTAAQSAIIAALPAEPDNTTLALIADYLMNKLSTTDNGDGTKTVVLYADDGSTPLKTWTFTEATGTRDAAV